MLAATMEVMQDPTLPPLVESLGIGPASAKEKALETRLHHVTAVLISVPL